MYLGDYDDGNHKNERDKRRVVSICSISSHANRLIKSYPANADC